METPPIPFNLREPEEVPETVETPAIAVNQSEPEEAPETVETPAVPANQSEPEEVPETVETLQFLLIRANQRWSQRPGRLCHCG